MTITANVIGIIISIIIFFYFTTEMDNMILGLVLSVSNWMLAYNFAPYYLALGALIVVIKVAIYYSPKNVWKRQRLLENTKKEREYKDCMSKLASGEQAFSSILTKIFRDDTDEKKSLRKTASNMRGICSLIKENENLIYEPVLQEFINVQIPIIVETSDTYTKAKNRVVDNDLNDKIKCESLQTLTLFEEPVKTMYDYLFALNVSSTEQELEKNLMLLMKEGPENVTSIKTGNELLDVAARLNMLESSQLSSHKCLKGAEYLIEIDKLAQREPETPGTKSIVREMEIRVLPTLKAAVSRIEASNERKVQSLNNDKLRKSSFEVIDRCVGILLKIYDRMLQTDVIDADADLALIKMMDIKEMPVNEVGEAG